MGMSCGHQLKVRRLTGIGRAQKQEFLAEWNMLLLQNTDLELFLNRIKYFLKQSFQVDTVMIATRQDDDFLLSGAKKRVISIVDIRALIKYIHEHHRYNSPLLTSEITDESLRQVVSLHHVQLVLPLGSGDGCLGLVLFGQRKKRYSQRELRLLETASEGLAISLNNALAISKINQLNEALQQKIIDTTTELRINNRQLQRLDTAKDEFISMASHQLRTPLTSIRGYIDMILEGDLGSINSTQRTVLSEAFKSSERMVQLISDFLSVSRLRTGRFVINCQPTDIAKLVKDEISLLTPISKQRQLRIITDIDVKIPQVSVDAEKIRQVIMNMIENALYYSKPRTTIHVQLARESNCMIFTVKDKGIGVREDEQANLFGKFFRGSNARQRRPDGTGIGLFLARKVILAHKGKIIFESKEGKGSTFGFRLPI